jgi:hypothetical protein
MNCYLTQDAIVTTETPEEAKELLEVLCVHVYVSDLQYNKLWIISYDSGRYKVVRNKLESLLHQRHDYPLLPMYTFQGFKHHFIKMSLFTSELVQGAMCSVPIYESHKRGTNWLAVIHVDPESPNGLGRDFCRKAKGEFYYFTDNLKENDAIEIGADYTSSGGNKSRRRQYGLVKSISADKIEIELFDTYKEAFAAQKEAIQ